MTNQELELLAFNECTSGDTTPHHRENDNTHFWNCDSYTFMYVPSFQFQKLPGQRNYLFSAEDKNGVCHTFIEKYPTALLTSIWKDIPEGVVRLSVYSLNQNNEKEFLIGARTFFKLSPFTSDLPEKSKPYSECVDSALDFALNEEVVNHWYKFGKPDPDYDLNVFPTKMITSIINAMCMLINNGYKNKEKLLKIAVNAADYLISITYKDNTALSGVPPTYQLDFRDDYEKRYNACAGERLDTVMTIYPAKAGISYLNLEEITGDIKYYDAALKIGEYYLKNVLSNGTWYLVVDVKTGKNIKDNFCDPLNDILPFLTQLYNRTNDKKWLIIAENAVKYIENDTLVRFNWEGQFEDSYMSVSYSNLTHYGPVSLIHYYLIYKKDDASKIELCKKLARFVEDQFVVWKTPAPWNFAGGNTAEWTTPAGLEQYMWHVPIDASTAFIMNMFLDMYKLTGEILYIEKAKALANSITRVQKENGMIPTHWINDAYRDGVNFWINCHLQTMKLLSVLDKFLIENNL